MTVCIHYHRSKKDIKKQDILPCESVYISGKNPCCCYISQDWSPDYLYISLDEFSHRFDVIYHLLLRAIFCYIFSRICLAVIRVIAFQRVRIYHFQKQKSTLFWKSFFNFKYRWTEKLNSTFATSCIRLVFSLSKAMK